jgi:hypothetical protein
MWVTHNHKTSLNNPTISSPYRYKPFPVMIGLWHCFTPMVKQCRKPLMTGNGKHTTKQKMVTGGWCVYGFLF